MLMCNRDFQPPRVPRLSRTLCGSGRVLITDNGTLTGGVKTIDGRPVYEVPHKVRKSRIIGGFNN